MARPPLRAERIPVYAAVKRCVDAWDPMGLLAGGAPPDEYECEIRMISERIFPGSAPETVAKAVDDVFSKMFWKNCLKAGISRNIAEKICAALNELAERSL